MRKVENFRCGIEKRSRGQDFPASLVRVCLVLLPDSANTKHTLPRAPTMLAVIRGLGGGG